MQTGSQIQVRRAERTDAAAISKVLHDSFAEFEALYTPAGFAATTATTEQVLTRLQGGPAWVATRHTEILGTVAAVLQGESAYMRGMAVLPAARGISVGARLLEEVEAWALQQGCGRVFLSTTPFLLAAIHLYEKFGFRRTDQGPDNLHGTPLFTMEKKLLRAS